MVPPDNDRSERKHRPLPSVNVALLPHEVRAARMRYVTVATLALLAVAVGVAVAFGRELLLGLDAGDREAEEAPWPSERAGQEAPEVLAASETGNAEPVDDAQLNIATASEGSGQVRPEQPEVVAALPSDPSSALPNPNAGATVVRPFGNARGFRDALLKAGALAEEADALIEALQKEVDFRRCRPEHELVFTRDESGALSGFEYRASVTEVYRAERRSDGSFRGFQAEVPVELRRVAKGGYIADSLGRALDALGLGRSLAGVFVEAFEDVIDFKKHSRAGDSFKVIVDERYVNDKFLGYGDVLALEYIGERSGDHRAFWFEPKEGRGDFHDENGRALHGGWLRTPLRYDHISSGYNLRRRHPILKRVVPHRGIDYAAAAGTRVWAAADGVVTFAGYRGANGNLVALKHAGGYETFYAHLSRITRGIKSGARVSQRQPIGAVGSTGRSTGPHLHFGLKRRGRFIDPKKQLNGPGKPLPPALMSRYRAHVRKLKAELAAIPLSAAPAPAGPDEQDAPEVFHEEVMDI